jgi:hypothetical protein
MFYAHARMLGQPTAGCDDLPFNHICSGRIVLGDEPPDGINIGGRLWRELK